MPRIVHAVFILTFFCLAGRTASAADELPPGAEPKMTVVLRSAQDLLDNLKFVFDLTTKKEQGQYQTVYDYLEVFLAGVDRGRPIRGGVILEKEDPNRGKKQGVEEDYRRYVWDFPYDVLKDWENNVLDFGIKFRKGRKAGPMALSGAFVGFMLYLDSKYAAITEQQRDLPEVASDPAKEVAGLLSDHYQAVAHISNVPEGQEQRRETFAVGSQGYIDRLKRDTDESEANFELRKARVRFRFNEIERLYAEAKDAFLGWTTQYQTKQGRLEGHIEALDGTSFASALDLVGKQASRFASVPRSSTPTLSGRLNHPLDEVRQKNMLQLLDALRTWSVARIDSFEDRNAEEKAASKQVAQLIWDQFAAGTKAGLLEMFIEVRPEEAGGHRAVAGVTTVNGENIIEMLKLIPNTRQGRQVELDVASEGDVRIHRVSVPKEDNPDYFEFLGSQEMLVGTSPDVIYFAAGPEGLEELKSAIKQAAAPDPAEAAPVVAEGIIDLDPWAELYHKQVTGGFIVYRQLAIAAFKEGEDTIEFRLEKNEKRINGWADAKLGVLRFIGKVIAEFSEKNLED